MSSFAFDVADFRPVLDTSVTEDARDAFALQVAPPSFTEEVGEKPETRVEFTSKTLARHKARSGERLLIEEIPELTTSSRDSKAVYAFKLVFHEVFALRNASRLSVVVHADEDQSSAMNKPFVGPTPLDFLSDVMLCAKRALGTANYLLLSQHADEGFIFWAQVPERVRNFIAERVGTMLIQRGIFKQRSTRAYWRNSYMLRAQKPAQQLEAA